MILPAKASVFSASRQNRSQKHSGRPAGFSGYFYIQPAYQNGVYTADFSCDHPQTLILAAAYDEGFTAEINGEPAEVYRVNDCQLAVRLPAGSGTVRLQYHTPGLRLAVMISWIAAAAALLLYLLRGKFPDRLRSAAGSGAAVLLQLGYGLVLLIVYIIPVAINLYGMIS